MAFHPTRVSGPLMQNPNAPAHPLLFVNVRPVLPPILQFLFVPVVVTFMFGTQSRKALNRSTANWWRWILQLCAVSGLVSKQALKRSSN